MSRLGVLLLVLHCLAMAHVGAPARAESRGAWFAGRTIGDNFGVQVKEWETNAHELDIIKATGFGLLRYGIGWPYVEDHEGHYDWTKYDRFIADVRARGLRSIIILWGSHPSYARGEKITPAPTSDAAVAGFARFAAAAAQRYQGDDVAWELWNEPDLGRFWPPRANPDAYARLALAACHSIRGVVASANVVGPAAASMPGANGGLGIGLMATVLRSPLNTCLDAISFHSYRIERGAAPKTPESVMQDNAKASAFIAQFVSQGKATLPLVCSEWGYNTHDLTPGLQAAYVLRTHVSNLLSGVPLTVWYEWRDSLEGSNDPESHYGLVDNRGRSKPAIEELKRVLPLIRDYRVERRIPTVDQQDFVVLLRGQGGERKLLVWTTRQQENGDVFVRVGDADKPVQLAALPRLIEIADDTVDVSAVRITTP